jgi:hypothetical protein
MRLPARPSFLSFGGKSRMRKEQHNGGENNNKQLCAAGSQIYF